jgi:ABC-type Fe3+/spermidine/putrescine transport system ATPase subunit
VLELEDVCSQAGTFRIRNVWLRVAEGESHVLLGPSGAGKTTLLELILGLRPLLSGTVRFAGRDITSEPIERRRFGYLPQRIALFPHLSVRENIVYGPRCHRQRAAEFQPVVDELVEATGISHLLDRQPETLSGGERQRVTLVRALATRPRLLLLDEPFTALNESLRREFWRLLKTLQNEYGFTMLMITHDLAEAFFMADRVTVLINGKVEQVGEKESVWRHPAALSVARFLGIRNTFEATVRQVDAEDVLVDCPALGGRLHATAVPGRHVPAVGDSLSVGIRAEFIALRDAAHPPTPGEHLLRGHIVDASVAGADGMLLFKPDGADALLEISVSHRLLRRFGVAVGQSVTVGLPPEDVLLLSRGDLNTEVMSTARRARRTNL